MNKLLNMSVLASELGGSIPVVEDVKLSSKSRRSSKGNLQDFMNSIDLRVMKSMQADQASKKNNLLADLFIGEGMQLITYLNKIKRIPMEKLNEKA